MRDNTTKIKVSSGGLIEIWILSAIIWVASVWLGVGTPDWIVGLCFWIFWLLLLPIIIIFGLVALAAIVTSRL